MTRIDLRKKPSQARSSATVDAIVEAAARILSADGLEGLNTNAVAALAGVSVGSLYQYFPNKHAVLTELLRRKRQRLLKNMRAALAETGPLTMEQGTRILVRAVLRNQAQSPRLARALEYANAALPLDQETEAVNREIIGSIANFLTVHEVPRAVDAAHDVVALTRGMMEQMSRAGELDETASVDRICMAIEGYVDRSRASRANG